MGPRDTFDHFQHGFEESFRPRIAKATGAIEEDRLRAAELSELLTNETEVEMLLRKTVGGEARE